MKLIINGNTVQSDAGKSILDAALDAGIYIPHLCSHPDLTPIGACGLCVVEIEGRAELASSCVTPAEEGMEVRTASAAIDAARRAVLARKLAGHPADCDSCVKYLNCELQSLKQYLIGDRPEIERKLRMFNENASNPLFVHNPTKCVQCGRCVRACHELRGVGVLYFKKRGADTYIGVGNTGAAPPPAAFDDLHAEQMKYIGGGEDRRLAETDCRFCGACAEVCPTGAVMDKHEFGQGKSRREALLPCSAACPAGVDVPRFLRFIREKNYGAANAVVREKVPLPLTLGYVCNRPCESACRRGELHEAISIRDMKRFAAERDTESLWRTAYGKKPETGKRVGIIGSGPAGLSAAYYLTVLGHSATIFEAMPLAGGMLRYGVPAYRLPPAVLDAEIAEIAATGVEIRTNSRVEAAASLLDAGCDAVLVAIGAHKGVALRLPGAKGEGVYVNTDFLRAAREGRPFPVGENTVVLGGGNVAFDCARVAKRLGAKRVFMAFLESREGMTASPDEIEQGEAEGVILHPSVTFTRILRDGAGAAAGVELLDVRSFCFDEDKRLVLETKEDSAHRLEADTVIFAVGQRPDIPEGFGLAKTEAGLIEADSHTMAASVEGVYAASDAVTGTDSVASAIASARKAALSIDRSLGGRGRLDERLAPADAPVKRIGTIEGFASLPGERERLLAPEVRIRDFRCPSLGLDEAAAERETRRCLQCDLRLKMTPVKFWGAY
ncbi:MAG: FAD-dependent oxidoreductase [Clostridiales Family XIII bacterium]|jgi:NADPH-dependent glutamate synthase beta subunit-like oxidoreductase/ferredoxin/NAD-dependent dihydropyrimidine dehydrogenase PreA subunit|nr:FAD-dependent oxidoreductase [Clostridiales Family XIII bacterium]